MGRSALPGGGPPATNVDPLRSYGLVHLTSAAGDALVAFALADSIFFSLPVGEAKLQVALYLALTMAPLAIAAPMLVPLLDRGGFRRAISFLAGAGRSAAALWAAPRLDSILLFSGIFTVLILSKVHILTKNGLTLAYAPRERSLVTANARLNRFAVAGVVTAACVGLPLTRIYGPIPVLYTAAGVYAVSALLNLWLKQPNMPPVPPSRVGKRGSVGPLAAAAAGAAGLRGAHGFLLFMLAFALRRAGDPEYWLGVLLVAGLSGAFVANVLAIRLEGLAEETVVVAALLGAGAACLVGLSVFSLPVLAIFTALAGGTTEAGRLGFQSLMQRIAPEHAHGRVFVRYEVLFQLSWVAGALVPALGPITYRGGLWLLAAFYLTCGLAVLTHRILATSHEPDVAIPSEERSRPSA
ncbi:MFS transporter [soil metagenome]